VNIIQRRESMARRQKNKSDPRKVLCAKCLKIISRKEANSSFKHRPKENVVERIFFCTQDHEDEYVKEYKTEYYSRRT
jgi:ribosomal protein S26